MSNLSLFLKKNKTAKENTFFAATKSLTDEQGEPLLWEIRAVPTKEHERIQEECTREMPVPGKRGATKTTVSTSALTAKLLAAAVVFPDLHSAELLDSYGVNKTEDLIREMIDNPGEYAEFLKFVMDYCGFDVDVNEEIEKAKN
jgi:hypothetical protein